MAPRAIASVKLSFGLVTIPVNIFTAGESTTRISFNWLHKKCGNRLRMQYYCPQDGDVVEKDERIKGYEFQKGEYVLFTPEELKVLEAKGTQTIDIAEFVPLDQVDRLYLEKVYYLGPDKGGDKAYHLLGAALRKTKRAAVAEYNARGKQYLVLIRPMGEKGLVMEQLHYHDEIKPFSEVPLGSASLKQTELKLAVQIVQQASSARFKPHQYKDEVRQRVLKTIQKKVDGEDITKIKASPQKKVIDLMDALKQSLATDHFGKKLTKKEIIEQAKKQSRTSGKASKSKKKRA